jgi:hypothetical protein
VWSGWTKRPARRQANAFVRITGVGLRAGNVELRWRLRPGDPGGVVSGVRLRAGLDSWPAEVLPIRDVGDEGTAGLFRVPLPEVDPPWSLDGYGPEGPWSEEVLLDAQILRDYRQGLAVPGPAFVEGGSVRLTVDRVSAWSDRLAVFYALDPTTQGQQLVTATTPVLRVAESLWQAFPPPGSAGGEWVLGGVAYFPPQLHHVGERAEFEVADAVLRSALPLDEFIPLPDGIPAVWEPDVELPSGHRVEEVVVSRHGVIVRARGGHDLRRWISFPELQTDDGHTLPLTGGSAAPATTLAAFAPPPPGTRSLRLVRAYLLEEVHGPWRIRFPIPMPL